MQWLEIHGPIHILLHFWIDKYDLVVISGIATIAYASLGVGELLQNRVVLMVSERRQRSPAQVRKSVGTLCTLMHTILLASVIMRHAVFPNLEQYGNKETLASQRISQEPLITQKRACVIKKMFV